MHYLHLPWPAISTLVTEENAIFHGIKCVESILKILRRKIGKAIVACMRNTAYNNDLLPVKLLFLVEKKNLVNNLPEG